VVQWRDELKELVDRIPADDLPDALGELARHQAVLQQRLLTPPPAIAAADGKRKYNRTVENVMERFSVKRSWVYAHRVELGGKKLDGALRFCDADLERYENSRRY